MLLVFTGASIARVFFISAATFASLSVWAYTTKRDLSGWGSFLFMGMIGIIIAALVNIFLQSTAMQFAISCIGVLVFAGFTAYDTQRIKDDYYAFAGDATMAAKASIFGALSLYQDFVGLFMNLLTAPRRPRITRRRHILQRRRAPQSRSPFSFAILVGGSYRGNTGQPRAHTVIPEGDAPAEAFSGTQGHMPRARELATERLLGPDSALRLPVAWPG